ncbi:MAG: aminomethyl-transferring glycine dehydrogenase [Caldilineaceae bacterium]|nr:aminomethyl-transferring glycine dehydrogenase [Caldilineaceae bacterium]MDE0336696.1 aminomethyl-transferring glycine dehydrogenase [Caldilineaceae bacterium]
MSPQPHTVPPKAASNGLGNASREGVARQLAEHASKKIGREGLLQRTDAFVPRHLGPDHDEQEAMLQTVGVDSLDQLIDQTIPAPIRLRRPLALPEPRPESDILAEMAELAGRNQLFRSFIGMGYYDTITPPVILRNVLENPGWYTQYTPYQAEIAQGRLEALLNFQTMVSDLTALDIANASLLDEATAAAEAMMMCKRAQKRGASGDTFFVSDKVHPQTIDTIKVRAEPLGYKIIVGEHSSFCPDSDTFGILLQYPDTEGTINDYRGLVEEAHAAGALVVVATDLLALTLLTPPGEWGADIAVGSAQRFGVPMGYGGPHAAFMATRDQLKRQMPGRLVGVSQDAQGRTALRLALQTREQHIRRDKATSNICTAQVLLAIMASMYAVYHGPAGLRRIAQRIQLLTSILASELQRLGYRITQSGTGPLFDTLKIDGGPCTQDELRRAAAAHRLNLRLYQDGAVGISLDEKTTAAELEALLEIFGRPSRSETASAIQDGMRNAIGPELAALASEVALDYPEPFARKSPYLTHPIFNTIKSETEMLRYITKLQNRDLSLAHSMIPLGSCTMKLNATAEMIPVTWPQLCGLHPFAPLEQAQGYLELFDRLAQALAEITGFAAVSLQPNAGSQGEYAGLLAIRALHLSRGDDHRDICLIPSSAHGTNPASAVMAGMKVVVVRCDEEGNIDLPDLRAKAEQHSKQLAALMVTYPSTHGVFEEAIQDVCDLVHLHGGQVYMDGANMNAQVGLCRPGDMGADVCHLNLHKTFCIPHGGGGPGMGPICVAEHLAPFLPAHAVVPGIGGPSAIGAVSAAPWGSAAILPISYAYIAMMGGSGLTEATRIAILNANYIAARLEPAYPVLYKGTQGRVAHECIIDTRFLKDHGLQVDDIAKRLIDFGFHAPTMSFPVAGTLMIEPTESESKDELDRFCAAMLAIREEVQAVQDGKISPEDSPLHHAPHTADQVAADQWDRAYSRETAVFPANWVRENKFWPAVSRIDNTYGDRNLVCACPPLESYA